jgi:signal transduction histidine kinase
MRLLGFRSWSLAVKFPLTLTAIVAAVGFTIGAAIVVQDWWRFRQALEEKALLLARAVAAAAPEAMLRNDYWALYKSLRGMAARAPGGVRDPRVMSGMVLDHVGRVLAHLDPALHPVGFPLVPGTTAEQGYFEAAMKAQTPSIIAGISRGEGFVEGVVPVYSDEKMIGVVRLRLSTAELAQQTRKAAFTVLSLTLLLVAAGSLFGTVISRRMVRPLAALAEGMESVGRGKVAQVAPVAVVERDEIGQLAVTFNRMAAELAEKERLERELAVNERMIALGRIAAGVAHEVNNPLAGMLNCLDTVKRHPEDADLTRRYLPLIEKGLNRIRAIVAGLLGELRYEDSNEIADPSCLEDVRDLVVAEIGSRDLALAWDNELAPGARLNRQKVQQILLNLLRNAIAVVPDGGRVAFRAFQDGDCAVLEVEDDGPGVPPENLGRLFEPFFTTRPGGTGLGLWIAYRLVRSMGGQIEVESEPGRGSLFRIFVPANQKKERQWEAAAS